MKILYCEDRFVSIGCILDVNYDCKYKILTFVVDSLKYEKYLLFNVNEKQAKYIMSKLLKSGFYDMTKFYLYSGDDF